MMRRPSTDEVVDRLRQPPVTVESALNTAHSALPAGGGFYGWWIVEGALPSVQGPPHPTVPGLRLLYVGIAPRNAASSSTIRFV